LDGQLRVGREWKARRSGKALEVTNEALLDRFMPISVPLEQARDRFVIRRQIRQAQVGQNAHAIAGATQAALESARRGKPGRGRPPEEAWSL
jgi:hypothetical protein